MDIRQRIDPLAFVNHLATRPGASEEDRIAFADWVRQEIIDDLNPKPGPRTQSLPWGDIKKAFNLLVVERGNEVCAWLAPLISGDSGTKLFMAFGSFPYDHLCRALLRHRPADGAKLWEVLIKLYDRDGVDAIHFSRLPFEAPDAPEVNAVRDLVCERAKNDAKLTRIAASTITFDRQTWMINRIRHDMTGKSAGQIARGLTLAGLLDQSEQADALWHDELAQAPGLGWLSDVHDWAHRLYRRNV
jgi:hypothetical protein